jgi:hypothetical protein
MARTGDTLPNISASNNRARRATFGTSWAGRYKNPKETLQQTSKAKTHRIKLKIPYWPILLCPWLSYAAGFVLNAIVMAFNGGQMPTLWPGGCTTFEVDMMHVCMTHASHLKFLADWIVIRDTGIASPGDFFIWAAQYTQDWLLYVWIALVVKDSNSKKT